MELKSRRGSIVKGLRRIVKQVKKITHQIKFTKFPLDEQHQVHPGDSPFVQHRLAAHAFQYGCGFYLPSGWVLGPTLGTAVQFESARFGK